MGASEDNLLAFYERKPVGRGLDFIENSDSKEEFLQCAVELQCLHQMAYTRKTPLPSLENLAEGATFLLEAGLSLGTKLMHDHEKAIREAGTQQD
jgi:hypothetical protein